MKKMEFTQDFFCQLVVGRFCSLEEVLKFIEENKKKIDWNCPIIDFYFSYSYKLDAPAILVEFFQRMIEDKVFAPTELMVQTALSNKDSLNIHMSRYLSFEDKILKEAQFHDVILMNTSREMINMVELKFLQNKERTLAMLKGSLCPEIVN